MGIHKIQIAIFGMVVAVITCASTFQKIHPRQNAGDMQYRLMFYNVENLFDIYDDSLTVDDDFTPSGGMHWTYKRYTAKIKNLFKVIIAAGGWQPPDIVGFCEIENRQVLRDLISNTPLSKCEYRIVHEDSRDRRGIDVALIYNNQTVRYIFSRYFRINKPGLFTRDILYLKVLLGCDTCHIFVNHWPSRSSGQLETEPHRFAAACMLKSLADSLFSINESARIVIMGDFNDDPTDESLVGKLKAQTTKGNTIPNALYNLSVAPSSKAIRGTLKYQGEWNIFDQIIVSGSMLSNETRINTNSTSNMKDNIMRVPDDHRNKNLSEEKGLSVSYNGYQVFREPFLLDIDEKYNGFKPYRTYNGFHYQGGFSDHLPVYVDLVSR